MPTGPQPALSAHPGDPLHGRPAPAEAEPARSSGEPATPSGTGLCEEVADTPIDQCEVWAADYSGSGNAEEVVTATVPSPDGQRLYVTGYSQGWRGGIRVADYVTLAYSTVDDPERDLRAGDQLWSARYDGPRGGLDVATAATVSPDGSRLFVTGASEGEAPGLSSRGGLDYATVAYDTETGSRLWLARLDWPASSEVDINHDLAWSVAISPDGERVFVTGQVGTLDRNADPYVGAEDSDYGTVAYEADTGRQLWANQYEGPLDASVAGGMDLAFSVTPSPDGGRVFVTGASVGAGTSTDYATVAYSAATGQELWEARYDGPGRGEDWAVSGAITPDGSRLLVTGRSEGSASSDYATVAYEATTGTQLWTARYEGPASGLDWAYSVAVSPDGARAYVTGVSLGTGYDAATVAYDTASGSEVWATRSTGPDYEDALQVRVSPDGTRVYVAGVTTGSAGRYDFLGEGYESSTGDVLWSASYDGPGRGSDLQSTLAVDPRGGAVYVGGAGVGLGNLSQGTSTFTDATTLALDAATGSQRWVSEYNGPADGRDEATATEVSPDGTTVYVTGYSAGFGENFEYDYATVAYATATGDERWVARYASPENGVDLAIDVAVAPDGGRVYVTGVSQNDYVTVAYDAPTGSELWVSRYAGPGEASADAPTTMALSGDGRRLYVAGNSAGDYATVAYDSDTGTELWVARYDGPAKGYDDPTGVAPSPDGGTVYVTGYSEDQSFDFATVAYDAASGDQIWLTRFDGPGGDTDVVYSLDVSPDGSRLFVTGLSADGLLFSAVGYDAQAGTQIFATHVPSIACGGNQALGNSRRLSGLSPDGMTLFAAYARPDLNGALVALDASTGAPRWTADFTQSGTGWSCPQAMRVSPNGSRVYVTGLGGGLQPVDFDYATAAYTADTGAVQWMARHNRSDVAGQLAKASIGADWDFPTSLAVSPDSARVYVTGYGGGTWNDYMTVAYAG